MSDLIKALSLMTQIADTTATAALNKELAISKNNTAITLQELTNEATTHNEGIKTTSGLLKDDLKTQQDYIKKITDRLDEFGVSRADWMKLGELDSTIEGGELWKSLEDEQKNNTMQWGKITSNIITNIDSMQQAKEINQHRISQLETALDQALEGADMFADLSIDADEDGIKTLKEVQVFYDTNPELRGAMDSIQAIAFRNTYLDPEGQKDLIAVENAALQGEALRREKELAPDREKLIEINIQKSEAQLEIAENALEDRELDKEAKEYRNRRSEIDEVKDAFALQQYDVAQELSDKYGLGMDFSGIATQIDPDDYHTTNPQVGAYTKLQSIEIASDLKQYIDGVDAVKRYTGFGSDKKSLLAKNYQKAMKFDVTKISTGMKDIQSKSDLDDYADRLAHNILSVLSVGSNKEMHHYMYIGQGDSPKTKYADFNTAASRKLALEQIFKNILSQEYGGEVDPSNAHESGFANVIIGGGDGQFDFAHFGTRGLKGAEYNDLMSQIKMYQGIMNTQTNYPGLQGVAAATTETPDEFDANHLMAQVDNLTDEDVQMLNEAEDIQEFVEIVYQESLEGLAVDKEMLWIKFNPNKEYTGSEEDDKYLLGQLKIHLSLDKLDPDKKEKVINSLSQLAPQIIDDDKAEEYKSNLDVSGRYGERIPTYDEAGNVIKEAKIEPYGTTEYDEQGNIISGKGSIYHSTVYDESGEINVEILGRIIEHRKTAEELNMSWDEYRDMKLSDPKVPDSVKDTIFANIDISDALASGRATLDDPDFDYSMEHSYLTSRKDKEGKYTDPVVAEAQRLVSEGVIKTDKQYGDYVRDAKIDDAEMQAMEASLLRRGGNFNERVTNTVSNIFSKNGITLQKYEEEDIIETIQNIYGLSMGNIKYGVTQEYYYQGSGADWRINKGHLRSREDTPKHGSGILNEDFFWRRIDRLTEVYATMPEQYRNTVSYTNWLVMQTNAPGFGDEGLGGSRVKSTIEGGSSAIQTEGYQFEDEDARNKFTDEIMKKMGFDVKKN